MYSPPDAGAAIDLLNDFGAWARLSAQLLRRTVGDRARIIFEAGVAAQWAPADAHWSAVIMADVQRGDLRRPNYYASLCREDLEARRRAGERWHSPSDELRAKVPPRRQFGAPRHSTSAPPPQSIMAPPPPPPPPPGAAEDAHRRIAQPTLTLPAPATAPVAFDAGASRAAAARRHSLALAAVPAIAAEQAVDPPTDVTQPDVLVSNTSAPGPNQHVGTAVDDDDTNTAPSSANRPSSETAASPAASPAPGADEAGSAAQAGAAQLSAAASGPGEQGLAPVNTLVADPAAPASKQPAVLQPTSDEAEHLDQTVVEGWTLKRYAWLSAELAHAPDRVDGVWLVYGVRDAEMRHTVTNAWNERLSAEPEMKARHAVLTERFRGMLSNA
ncbi:MAG TPA: hypothetical protein ENK23_04145 [Sorangium sp.]|nr:hypothetical protein [Sorangium sp.]